MSSRTGNLVLILALFPVNTFPLSAAARSMDVKSDSLYGKTCTKASKARRYSLRIKKLSESHDKSAEATQLLG